MVSAAREINVRIEPLLLERKYNPANSPEEIVRAGKMFASCN